LSNAVILRDMKQNRILKTRKPDQALLNQVFIG